MTTNVGDNVHRARIALVYPPFDDKRDRSAYYVAPPLGLLYIARYLERACHEVRIHDFIFELKSGSLREGKNIYVECAARIASYAPDIVCFSTQCTTNPGSVNIARYLKQFLPDVCILFGGHDVSFIAERYLEAFPFIDFILAGEAELTLVKFVESFRGGRDYDGIEGLSYRRNGQICTVTGEDRILNLDDLPLPAYHLVAPLSEYFALSRIPTILIDSGRGCAFACEFCQTTLLTGTKLRYRSVESLIAEMSHYKKLYGGYEAYFVHDLFTARRGFVESLCMRLLQEDLGLHWQCRCRLDQVDESLLDLMGGAGCRMLLYGVESGSENTLVRINKRLKTGMSAQVRNRVQATINAGIFPSLSMVVGTPEESLDDLCQTMRLAHDFVKMGRVNAFIQLMSPLPGTALAKRLASRLIYRGTDAPTAFSQGIEFDNGSRLCEDELLVRDYPQVFQSFQTVIPDHGDIDLCIDVSLAFCKLLEVYCHTFDCIQADFALDHLTLFQAWRSELLRKRGGGKTLAGIRDFELWDSFSVFAQHWANSTSASVNLKDAYRYESIVHELSVLPPVVPPDYTSMPIRGVILRLHPNCRLLSGHMPFLHPRSGPDVASYLIFMSRDRLHAVEVPKPIADALTMLSEDDSDSNSSLIISERIYGLLEPLIRYGAIIERAYNPTALLSNLESVANM